MKKRVCILCIMLLAFSLPAMTGCTAAEPVIVAEPDFTEIHTIVRNQHSDIPGVSVQAGNLYTDSEKTELVVVWNNRTEYPVQFGEPYWIQRLENSQWVSCAQGETVFPSAAYKISPKNMENRSYKVTDLYDLSKPGTYRFLTSCTVEMESGQWVDCSLWSEFTVDPSLLR